MKKNKLGICFISIIILSTNIICLPICAKCNTLSRRYSLTATTVVSGNIGTSTPVSCTYHIRKIRKTGKNRFLYAGTDCTGTYQSFNIIKSCNNISFSLPQRGAGFAIDSFGNVLVQDKTTFLSCSGSLTNYQAVLGQCSGRTNIGNVPFIITGSFNAYKNRVFVERNQRLVEDSYSPAVSKDSEQMLEIHYSLFNDNE